MIVPLNRVTRSWCAFLHLRGHRTERRILNAHVVGRVLNVLNMGFMQHCAYERGRVDMDACFVVGGCLKTAQSSGLKAVPCSWKVYDAMKTEDAQLEATFWHRLIRS
jgi:hypothetical protein